MRPIHIKPSRLPAYKVGKEAYVTQNDIEETVQMADVTPETILFDIASATNSTTYVFSSDLYAETLSVTTDASATVAEFRDAIIAAWNAHELYGSAGVAAASGNDVLVSLRFPATALNMKLDSGVAADIAFVETPESEPTIAYGVPVYRDGDNRATTTKPAGTVLANLKGISYFDLATERENSDVAQTERTRRMLRIKKNGCIGVINSDTTAAKRGGDVYIGTGAGEENKFYTTTGAGRELIPNYLMSWRADGVVQIKFPG